MNTWGELAPRYTAETGLLLDRAQRAIDDAVKLGAAQLRAPLQTEPGWRRHILAPYPQDAPVHPRQTGFEATAPSKQPDLDGAMKNGPVITGSE